MKVDSIAILDCGGQYTKVIDRKVRQLSVRSDIHPLSVSPDVLAGYQGIILSGGPNSVWAPDRLPYDPGIFDLGIPVLGICYGMQLINQHFGGVVAPGRVGEYGEATVRLDPACPLFAGLETEQRVLMSHGDSAQTTPEGFSVSATSPDAVAAIYHEERKIYGVQFHPEVDLTPSGLAILRNFLTGICGLTGNYTMDDRIEEAVRRIRERVGGKPILVLVSGGVDSAVSAALLLRALGPDSVYAIHVDHGLMRKNESDAVCESLRKLGLKHLIRHDAEKTFLHEPAMVDGRPLGPLTSLVDPEERRVLIGTHFVEAVRSVANGLALDLETTFWAQGTLRPDLIESGNPDVSSFAHKIKTHHNDIDVIRRARQKGLVVETNWDWHKDEVRQVARQLGIAESIASRQPFPGPGLAVRVLCNDGTAAVTPRETDLVERLVRQWNDGYEVQLVPLRTVGVQGDQRSYRNLAVVAGKGMRADWARLAELGPMIPGAHSGVNRVAYVVNRARIGEGLTTRPLWISEANIALLREVDHLVTSALAGPAVSQVFPVLLPLGRGDGRYSVAIRAFVTNDFMTGRPARIGGEIPLSVMEGLVEKIVSSFGEIDLVLYDITPKPPGTVEWQ